MRPQAITNFFHSRNCAALSAVVMVVASVIAFSAGRVLPISGNRGLLFHSANLWISAPALSMVVNLLLTLGIGVLSIAILKTFNIMRVQTALWAALFVAAQGALPSVAAQFYSGTLLCMAVAIILVLMLSCYADRSQTRRVFLIFFIIALGSMMQYAFMFFIPALLLGLAQMRIFSIRTLVAAIFGLATPLWIVFGFGLATFDDISFPDLGETISRLPTPTLIITFTIVGFTLLISGAALCSNLMKTLSYNAKFRAANGFISLLLITTAILTLCDYQNLSVYIPTLNFLGAYQIAHFFSYNRRKNSWIVVALIFTIYLGAYIASSIF